MNTDTHGSGRRRSLWKSAALVTALAQALVLALAVMFLITRNPQVATWTPPEWRGFGGNAFVAMLFGGSVVLFRSAGRDIT
jgi:hypothetical protein